MKRFTTSFGQLSCAFLGVILLLHPCVAVAEDVEGPDVLSVSEMPELPVALDVEAFEVATYIINYNNISVIEYIRFLSKITGTNFVFDPGELEFTMTIVSEEPTTIDGLMSILLQVLQVNGFSLAQDGNQILIYQNAQLAKLAPVVTDDDAEMGELPAIVTRVFHITNGSPEDAAKLVQPLLSGAAAVQAMASTGHLIVTDVAANIMKVEELLESIGEKEVAFYEVTNSYAEAVVELAEKILTPLGGKDVTLVAQPSTDSIFIVASPAMIRRTLGILQMLDVPSAGPVTSTLATPTVPSQVPGVPLPGQVPSGTASTIGPLVTSPPETAPPIRPKSDAETTTFSIYKLQYHQGDEIKEALQEIAASLKEVDGATTNLVKTISTVQWIRTTNSLVISGNKASIARVNAVIEDLDIPLREVYIETLVIRTTMANVLNMGVEWGFRTTYDGGGINPDIVQGGWASTKGANSGLIPRLNPGQIPAPVPLSEGLGGGVVGRFVNFNGRLFTSLGLLVDAFQQCNTITIMLNPKVMTLDNHEARIFVGSNIAFQGSTITQPGSETVVGEIIYRDIGTELLVRPILSNSDMVTLDITQLIEQNDASQDDSNVATVFPTLKSEARTRVTVPDGYFVILSGQINNQRRNDHRGLPCLGGLPVIGTCFSTKNKTDSRDNLVIFIRPHIISTKPEMVHITECEKRRYDAATAPGSYQMDLETILDVLNIKCEECKPCPNPLDCDCGYPCDDFRTNLWRGPCYHSCDDFVDDYFSYPFPPEQP